LLKKNYNLSPVSIYLHKIIPVGAGLGGGSSDAAHTLLLLNEIFYLSLSLKEFTDYSMLLGSDCAFFIHHRPMLAKGKGELLSEIEVSLKNYFIVIVKPSVHVNTADTYQLVTPAPAQTSIETIIKQPLEKWKNQLKNDFEVS